MLPGRVVPRGAVAVRDGLIVEIAPSAYQLRVVTDTVLDAGGAYLVPGVVDIHNDGLELEVNPRPAAELPLPFALSAMERRLIASGITTELHALSFMDRIAKGRTVGGAVDRAAHIGGLGGDTAVDHQILHRIDVWSPHYLDQVFASVARMAVRYATLNDHTPGQGQFADPEQHVKRMGEYAKMRGAPPPELDGVLRLIADRATRPETVTTVYARVRDEATRLGMVIGTHDDDSPAKVDVQRALGATVCEFPVTVEAARRAREHGMTIVLGAPNVLRGGSQSGNLSAAELIQLGLGDALCADYHAPSLLPAAWRLVRDGIWDLPTAIRSITLNPARAVGLGDRGAIAPGQRADLLLVRLDGHGLPCVETALRGGVMVYRFAERVRVLA